MSNENNAGVDLDKQRAEFEAQLLSNWSREKTTDDNGDLAYVSDMTQFAFIGWCMARRASATPSSKDARGEPIPKYETVLLTGDRGRINDATIKEAMLDEIDAYRKLYSTPMPAGAAAPSAEQASARLPHALSVFNEHMPPGGLSSIGHANIGKALLAILSESVLSAGAAAKTEQPPIPEAKEYFHSLQRVVTDQWMGGFNECRAALQASAAGAGSEQAQALRHIQALADFAYEQGFHELGYDPVAVISAALAQQAAPEAPATTASGSDFDASKGIYWFGCLEKCAQLLALPDDEPIPSGVVAAVERLIAEARAADGQQGASRAALDVIERIYKEADAHSGDRMQRASYFSRAIRAALARAPLPAQGCKWPTCESEKVQQEIADQAYRELYSGEQAQAVDDARDAARLDFMATEECQIEHLDLPGKAPLYRVRWPYLESHYREWSCTAREAIDAAMSASRPDDKGEKA